MALAAVHRPIHPGSMGGNSIDAIRELANFVFDHLPSADEG
jgi:hypothetical protein